MAPRSVSLNAVAYFSSHWKGVPASLAELFKSIFSLDASGTAAGSGLFVSIFLSDFPGAGFVRQADERRLTFEDAK